MEIQEQIRDAKASVESQVEVEADPRLGVTMTPTQLKSAGYVYIWDMETHERSICNRNMLAHNLQKMRNGKPVFTTVQPTEQPKRGGYLCMLHPFSPGRKHYDELGLAVCMKDNLANPYQVRRHMEKRHKMEFATIRDETEAAEKLQERQLRESLIRVGNEGAKSE